MRLRTEMRLSFEFLPMKLVFGAPRRDLQELTTFFWRLPSSSLTAILYDPSSPSPALSHRVVDRQRKADLDSRKGKGWQMIWVLKSLPPKLFPIKMFPAFLD